MTESTPHSSHLVDLVDLNEHRRTRQGAKDNSKSQVPHDDVVRIVTSNNAPPSATAPAQINFDRRELDMILGVYGRMVAAGEWRDYAIDHLRDRAVFSAFQRTAEVPLYTIQKDPRMARRQGAYSVVTAAGQILKRGHDLQQVLKVFDKKPKFDVV